MDYTLRIHTDSGLISLSVASGSRLIDALALGGVSLDAPCGGRCFCGKCRVRAGGTLSPISETECGLLSRVDREAGIRLACAATIEGDAEVWIEAKASQILTEGENEAPVALDPPIALKRIEIFEPTLSDQQCDEGRLAKALGLRDIEVPLPILRLLPGLCREAGDGLWGAMYRAGSAVCLRGLYPSEPDLYGAAVDIGTTTVAAYLVNLKTGQSLDACSMLNPQRAHGADVISRSDFAAQPGGLETLRAEIAEGIAGLIGGMLRKHGASNDSLRHIVCVGNTVMMHLFWGVTPKHISVTPFVPAFCGARRAEASDIGLPFAQTLAETAPCVAGYIGADTVAAILACDMDQAEGTSLLIDIGTNGEIALGGKAGIVCCSAAAGPAFEGAHIRCGSGAVSGAISGVRLESDGTAALRQIGGGEPRSICGSGLVDAVAELLRRGVIDETGRIDPDEAPEPYAGRLFASDAGVAFPLDASGKVFLCQRDVREVQLAKSAIAAGIEILMEQANVDFAAIGHLYLAGGFGNFIDVHNACAIGLLPAELEDRVVPIGNAAGTGARHMLLNREAGERAAALSRSMRYIELSAQKSFADRFAEDMLFPEI